MSYTIMPPCQGDTQGRNAGCEFLLLFPSIPVISSSIGVGPIPETLSLTLARCDWTWLADYGWFCMYCDQFPPEWWGPPQGY